MNNLYAICYDDPESNEPRFIYIGVTVRTIEQRWNEHQAGIKDFHNQKDLYVYIRQNGIEDRVYIILVASATDEPEQWEDYWIRTLIAEGHPLQNMTGGNKKVAAKRGSKRNLLKEAEKSHYQRFPEPVEELYERIDGKLQRVESFSNSKTKSDTLRDRVLSSAPSTQQLDQAKWSDGTEWSMDGWEVWEWNGYVFFRQRVSKRTYCVQVLNIKEDRMLSRESSSYRLCYEWIQKHWKDDGKFYYDRDGWEPMNGKYQSPHV